MTAVTAAELQRSPLLAGLPDELLTALAGAATRRTLDDGEALFEQGQPAEHLYAVLSGAIVLREGEDRRALIVEQLGPGDVVGWSAMREDARTLSTGRASGSAQVIAIPVETVIGLVTGGGRGSRELFRRIVGLAARHLEDAWRQLRQTGREGVISGG